MKNVFTFDTVVQPWKGFWIFYIHVGWAVGGSSFTEQDTVTQCGYKPHTHFINYGFIVSNEIFWRDLLLSDDTSEWISRSLHAFVFSAPQDKRKRPWARIDSDVWVKRSVRQMNSDSMFITLLHTALHTHAVFKINKHPSFHHPLSWTKIDLAPQTHRRLGRNHTRLQSSLVGITHIVQYHRILHGQNE